MQDNLIIIEVLLAIPWIESLHWWALEAIHQCISHLEVLKTLEHLWNDYVCKKYGKRCRTASHVRQWIKEGKIKTPTLPSTPPTNLPSDFVGPFSMSRKASHNLMPFFIIHKNDPNKLNGKHWEYYCLRFSKLDLSDSGAVFYHWW